MSFKEYSFQDLLSNIVDNRGKTCPVTDSGIPLIATNCIKNDSLYPVYEKIRFVDDETYQNWFRGHPEPEDIIFVCKGSPGRVAWTQNPVPFCIAQDMVAIRANQDLVFPKYLFALLRSPKTQKKIEDMHVGSLIPHFKKGDFKNLYLDIIEDKVIQKKIGDIYFSFCEKIEANRQINQTLEEMAQAIFKSWFVYFEPVKAKIAVLENGGTQADATLAAMQVISGKTTQQLQTLQAQHPDKYQQLHQTADLFPNAMQNSELGKIPKGWRVSEIGNEVTVVGGGTPSTKIPEFWDDGEINWATPKDLSSLQDKVLLNTDRKITPAGLTKISSGLLPENTVLMSSRAPVGYLALAKVPVAVNQGFIAMKCEGELTPEFVLQWCDSVMDQIQNRASGTTFMEISKKNFKPIAVIVPSKAVMERFSTTVGNLYDGIKSNVVQSKSLAKIRDSLLPKLLSGDFN
ncbi:restriction endonuclease subunit S [Thiomicrorhabdus xiamenensis]|uniref:Restriction endonuclease subunit S n=1 Tax=Thiomicrorhabdus xiamenensis TaxID=2739063 RepID=A0A7D4TER9_9GAMM|nr:restriction endonuclease subunit S [Thiomicrorhabdus xiamenensis]QKI89627.1 restriction endonuclease subunit S [Thiomicrorhabdus xiamenensis]